MPRIRWSQWGRWGVLGWIALLGMGCAHAISDSLRAQAEPPLPFAQLRVNPEAYKDHTVILGGEILSTEPLRDGTRIEVLQKPLDRAEAPRITDNTGGRFMAFCDGYLDPAVYAPGRRITVAGRVLGTYAGKVGELEYHYPLISCQEAHLWSRVVAVPHGYYAYPGWYWNRYVYPWSRRPYRYRFGFFPHP
jgi:outer membrane lipoprotein